MEAAGLQAGGGITQGTGLGGAGRGTQGDLALGGSQWEPGGQMQALGTVWERLGPWEGNWGRIQDPGPDGGSPGGTGDCSGGCRPHRAPGSWGSLQGGDGGIRDHLGGVRTPPGPGRPGHRCRGRSVPEGVNLGPPGGRNRPPGVG